MVENHAVGYRRWSSRGDLWHSMGDDDARAHEKYEPQLARGPEEHVDERNLQVPEREDSYQYDSSFRTRDAKQQRRSRVSSERHAEVQPRGASLDVGESVLFRIISLFFLLDQMFQFRKRFCRRTSITRHPSQIRAGSYRFETSFARKSRIEPPDRYGRAQTRERNRR